MRSRKQRGYHKKGGRFQNPFPEYYDPAPLPMMRFFGDVEID